MAADTKDKTVHETLLSSQMETAVVDDQTHESRNYRRLVVVLGGVILCMAIAVGLLCFLLGTFNNGGVQTTTSFCQGQDCQASSTHGPTAESHNQNQTVARNAIQTTTAQTPNYNHVTNATTTTTTTTTNQPQAEMQKAADPADISVLFFSSWC